MRKKTKRGGGKRESGEELTSNPNTQKGRYTRQVDRRRDCGAIQKGFAARELG